MTQEKLDEAVEKMIPMEKKIFYLMDGVPHGAILTNEWLFKVTKVLAQALENPPQ